jgi:hypothetical protein
LRTYLPQTFTLPFCTDQIEAVKTTQKVILVGGKHALAMPRGQGKSAICKGACLWGALNGFGRFFALIGANDEKAGESMDSLKRWLEVNELLLEDFPEVVFPIRRLERIANRCKGQTYQGKPTYIEWDSGRIVLPTIEGSAASSCAIMTAGLGSAIRGMAFTRPDGIEARPSHVLIDDAQTDASAGSVAMTQTRKRAITRGIEGLAGPDQSLGIMMPCTVMRKGDLAEEFLDRKLHPDWQGRRTKMLYEWPARKDLWDEYWRIRNDGLAARDDGSAGIEFYRSHRAEMDAGAKVAWEHRIKPGDLSALQTAMNLWFSDKAAFMSEMQNDPEPDDIPDQDYVLSADQIRGKINRHDRRVLLRGTTHVVAFIDVQMRALFYAVAGFGEGFTGSIVDYGCWPEQGKAWFTLREIDRTLQLIEAQRLNVRPEDLALDQALFAGLQSLIDHLCGREWIRDDGQALRIGKLLVDANWDQSTKVVYHVCRQSSHAAVLQPSHGLASSASSRPLDEAKKEEGEIKGNNWRLKRSDKGRRLVFDANYWKTFLFGRWATGQGGKGNLTLFGSDPKQHELFAAHLTAEYGVKTSGRGRDLVEWRQRPGRDNHWLDCCAGCCVAASMLGLALESHGSGARPQQQPVSFREQYQQARRKK